MASDTHDISRDQFMLTGGFARQGYDWWWHSFSGYHAITGERRTFFIEFFCCNPALGGPRPILGQLPENLAHDRKPSYVMVKAGAWGAADAGHGTGPAAADAGRGAGAAAKAKQLHRFFAWDDVDLGTGTPFYVAADDCLCCETDLIGSVSVTVEDATAHPEWMCDAGTMAWDLAVDKQIAFNVGFGASKPMRDAQAFEMFWHAEGIKTAYAGTVVLDGETYLVDPETCYGYADKNWGADFTSPWVWLSSCNLVSNVTGRRLGNSAFEIGGGRPKVAGVALERKLLGCINYEGRSYEFNFSKPWTGSTTRFDCCETDDAVVWHVEQETFDARLVTDVTCPKAEMLLVNYEAPNGTKRHNRLWNGGTGIGRVQLFERTGFGKDRAFMLVDDIHAETIGCEYGEYDR